MLAAGARHQDKVAQYLYKSPEYLESMFGMFKAGLVPVNTNYRYTEDELAYLWDNADAVAVVFHGAFTERCAALRQRLPTLRTWIWVDDGSEPCPAWAIPYEQAARSAADRVVAPWGRSPDDVFLLYTGGPVITLEGRHFDPRELLDAIETHSVNSISIVGDAFAKPVLRALDAEPDRWDISELRVIFSSGVMWAAESKAGLLGRNARLTMVDSLGSSEAIGLGVSTTTAESSSTTAEFRVGAHARVIDEHGRDVEPGSGARGRLALRGRTPLGYYKDEAKSAATFVTIDNDRWSIPGDWAAVNADGTIRLYGRGSQCINTGGEKVYPEEVEEALKLYPTIADAAVVAVPDERFGEGVTALVELLPGQELDEALLIAHVRTTLAAYKAPKRIFAVPSLQRSPNGKLDVARLAGVARQRSGRH